MKYQIAAITHPGTRVDNQDNFFCNGIYKKSLDEQELEVEMQACSANHNVYAVADGVGGLHEGGKAALLVCNALYDKCWEEGSDAGSALLTADAYIMNAGIQSRFSMGSTCVIVEEKAGHLRSWNVGDSRAYLYKDGELTQISKDHTEAENARAIQKATGEDFKISDRLEHSLTQYLGADKTIYSAEPFVSDWITAGEGNKYILCSDGLYNYVEVSTIKGILANDIPTIAKCRMLVDEALSNRGNDNVTVVVVEDER